MPDYSERLMPLKTVMMLLSVTQKCKDLGINYYKLRLLCQQKKIKAINMREGIAGSRRDRWLTSEKSMHESLDNLLKNTATEGYENK